MDEYSIHFKCSCHSIRFNSIQFRWQLFQINRNAVARSIRTYLTNHIITVHIVCWIHCNVMQSKAKRSTIYGRRSVSHQHKNCTRKIEWSNQICWSSTVHKHNTLCLHWTWFSDNFSRIVVIYYLFVSCFNNKPPVPWMAKQPNKRIMLAMAVNYTKIVVILNAMHVTQHSLLCKRRWRRWRRQRKTIWPDWMLKCAKKKQRNANRNYHFTLVLQ